MDLTYRHVILEIELFVLVVSHIYILGDHIGVCEICGTCINNLLKIFLILIIKLAEDVIHDVLALGGRNFLVFLPSSEILIHLFLFVSKSTLWLEVLIHRSVPFLSDIKSLKI